VVAVVAQVNGAALLPLHDDAFNCKFKGFGGGGGGGGNCALASAKAQLATTAINNTLMAFI
jgi:hypothetical protein